MNLKANELIFKVSEYINSVRPYLANLDPSSPCPDRAMKGWVYYDDKQFVQDDTIKVECSKWPNIINTIPLKDRHI